MSPTLGDPLDELNFWEGPWIEANKEKKKVRNERGRLRKRQQRYGGLTAAGRKRAYKKRAEAMQKRICGIGGLTGVGGLFVPSQGALANHYTG